MDLTNLLVDSKSHGSRRTNQYVEGLPGNAQYWDQGVASGEANGGEEYRSLSPHTAHKSNDAFVDNAGPASAPAKLGKHVTFELLLNGASRHRARLPMRVNIYPHDTTESIVTTVKNFYGLYEKWGIAFENSQHDTLIARYENFEHNMTVYIRTVANDSDSATDDNNADRSKSLSPRRPRLDEPFSAVPHPHNSHTPPRPSSRIARKRSASPQSSHYRRSISTQAKPSTRPGKAQSHGSFTEALRDTTIVTHSDSEEGGSVTSSRRARNETLASAEISLENIVEGGRRKRAKFDSSELPLFVPPQVPGSASLHSVSPQRKVETPYLGPQPAYTNQHPFIYPQPLPSPQSHGYNEHVHAHGAGQMTTPISAPPGRHGHKLRTRGPNPYSSRHSLSIHGVLPTPDPTIGGSVISDEDAALQLMRLGDLSNISTHGRTSTSTLDDALSGKAEVASSDGTDDTDMEESSSVGQRGAWPAGQTSNAAESSGDEYGNEHGHQERKHGSNGQAAGSFQPINKKPRLNPVAKSSTKSTKARAHSPKKSKASTTSASRTPISPASLPPQSRKQSINAILSSAPQLLPSPGGPPHHPQTYEPVPRLGEDEEDLSAKPRCQRCRKSKKGCDRQRPCGRCRDAGIGVEGCVSEDEVNGRKGRYGRHMGVTVKKSAATGGASVGAPSSAGGSAPQTPGSQVGQQAYGFVGATPAVGPLSAAGSEKGKKRKR